MFKKHSKVFRVAICDHCLGRQYAQLLSGYSNDQRGEMIRRSAAIAIDSNTIDDSDIDQSNFIGIKFRQNKEFGKLVSKSKNKKCQVCNGFFANIDKTVQKIVHALKGIEFSTFLVGTIPSRDLLEREEQAWEVIGIDFCEPIRAEINREVGKRLEKVLKKRANLKNPEISIILNLAKGKIEVKCNPLFIFGYYNKLKRGFPQCKWGTPKKYKTSVEQIVGGPILKASCGVDHKFHGCVAGNTKITLNECSLPISDLGGCWEEHDLITYNTKTMNKGTSKISDFIKLKTKMGIKTYEIKTRETGRTLIASEDHPIFTNKGMVPISKLKVNGKVAVFPLIQDECEGISEKIIVTEKDVLKNIQKYVPTSNKNKILKELKKNNLLPLSTKNKKFLALIRLLAFLFGDGNIRYSRNRDASIEFYGKKEDLYTIRSDIKNLGFRCASSIRKRKSYSEVMGYNGKVRIISGIGYSMSVYPKPLWILLVSMGAPLGDKIINKTKIPNWVKRGSKEIKREFLASLFGAEMSKPRLDNRKYNKKSFNTPTFSINKSEKLLKNGISFMSDVKKMLNAFRVKSLSLRKIPYCTRKDWNKTFKLRLDISNKFENLMNLYGNVGFRYCEEREISASHVYEYFLIKKRIVDMRKKAYKKALELSRKGLTPTKIHKKIGNKYISFKNIAMWVSPKNKEKTFSSIKIPNNFPEFEKWKIDVTNGLKGGLVWEIIESVNRKDVPHVYDLTTQNNHHTFFANGFLVSNSGREDIDAICLGKRAFVLEITQPKKRNINLKVLAKKINRSGKVKVFSLTKSNMNTVRAIKSARPGKTYHALVKTRKKIKKSDLRKLSKLKGIIKQRTPERVKHRRADLMRKRKVFSIKTKYKNSSSFELVVKTDAGLYVKELVSGDSGRTVPSVRSLLGVQAVVKTLDVINIEKIKV